MADNDDIPVPADDDDAEAFKALVEYFFVEKGDPTSFSDWDAARCQRLMPQFFEAWTKAELYRGIAVTCAKAGR